MSNAVGHTAESHPLLAGTAALPVWSSSLSNSVRSGSAFATTTYWNELLGLANRRRSKSSCKEREPGCKSVRGHVSWTFQPKRASHAPSLHTSLGNFIFLNITNRMPSIPSKRCKPIHKVYFPLIYTTRSPQRLHTKPSAVQESRRSSTSKPPARTNC